jgi:hypothetical protein
VSEQTGSESFDDWFTDLVPSDERRGEVREWFLALFEEKGAVGRDAANMTYQMDQLAMAELALAEVLADLHRTSVLRPEVRIDNYGNGVRITVDENYGEPSIDSEPYEQPMLQQVADYIQDQVMSDHLIVWPSCPKHATGLHSDLIDGVATWRCRFGQHDVSRVGQLGSR